jgi:hypothetical protein
MKIILARRISFGNIISDVEVTGVWERLAEDILQVDSDCVLTSGIKLQPNRAKRKKIVNNRCVGFWITEVPWIFRNLSSLFTLS